MKHWLMVNEPGIPEEVQKEVDALHPTNFLFGSRRMSCYFGYEGRAEESDWDFAFPYEGSEALEVEKAKNLGWTERPTEKYKDDMHFMTWEKIIGGRKVQMCSKINLFLFKRVFQAIEPEFYWGYIHKSSPDVMPKQTQTAVFNQFYKMKAVSIAYVKPGNDI